MPAQPAIAPFPNNLPVATIHEVDFSALAAGSPSEAHKVYSASTGYGFFYLTNHNIDHSFMFELADEVFSLPQPEKNKYDMGTTGHYFGYKRSGAMIVDDKGTPDQSEFYNISKDEILGVTKDESGRRSSSSQQQQQQNHHPDVVLARRGELEGFMRQCHAVVTVLVRVLGQQLGLPDGLLESLHRIDRPSVCQARVTHAPPVSDDTICLGEHTDFGSVTVLFNQLGGLQVLAPDTPHFQYVRPRPDCAVINLGDSLIKLCGNNPDEDSINSDGNANENKDKSKKSNKQKPRLRSAVHRVLGPPGAQAQSHRHSVVYFARPNSEVLLRDLFVDPDGEKANSKAKAQAAAEEEEEEEEEEEAGNGEEQVMNADQWVLQRARNWNASNFKGRESYRASRGMEFNAQD